MVKEVVEWSEWYDPKKKLFSLGMYVQVQNICRACLKDQTCEGIVTNVDPARNCYDLAPSQDSLCYGYVLRWRYRIIGVLDEQEEEDKVEEPA